MNPQPAGIYIHIPFCPKKCGYCNFYSVTSLTRIPEFLAALFREIGIYAPALHTSRFDSLYIGGGSPSLLSAENLNDLLARIRNSFDLSPDAEITIEVNPGDIDFSYFKALHNLGINRVNIGVQSFDENVLTFLERRHTCHEAFGAIADANQAGFENIGLDLIYGVPGQDIPSWLDTLLLSLSFAPAHLSCYQLTFEPDTPLGKRIEEGEFYLPDNDTQYDFFMKTSEMLEKAGYIHYEVSNFARDITLLSKHNQKYWDHSPYLGLGPSAHSFAGNKRWWNHKSVEKYTEDLKVEKLPIEDSEVLTSEQLQLEALLLGLRTKKGINLQSFEERFGRDLLTDKREMLTNLVKAEVLIIEEGFLRPTLTGLAVADSLSLI